VATSQSITSDQIGIYAIRHVESGKLYIGSAVSIKRRWKLHRSHLDAGRHHSYTLQRAWSEYGSEAFVFEVLEVVPDKNDLTLIEQRYFDQFRPFDSELGYNVSPTAGSPLGTKHGPEFRAKVSAAVRNASPEVRAKRRAAILTPEAQANAITARQTPEVRAKMSASQAANVTDETRARMAEIRRNWTPHTEQKRLAGIRTPEARERNAAARRGRKHTAEHNAKIKASSMGKKRPKTQEHREKIAATLRGRTLSPEHKANISAGGIGRKLSLEHKAKLSTAWLGRKRGPLTPEQKAKISSVTRGRKKSLETRAKMKAAWVRRKEAGHVGYRPTKETLAKRSASCKAAWVRRREKATPERQLKLAFPED
jgi:group I intron endonuclease